MSLFHQEQMRFLNAHTNEKQVLLNEIITYVKKNQVRSILDVGPGDGAISIPLSKAVSRYKCIESDSNYIEKLKNNGLDILLGRFPPREKIKDSFDMVLFSHVIFDYGDLYSQMLEEAWALVSMGGILLVISNNPLDKNDPWQRLRSTLDPERALFSETRFKHLLAILQKFGTVEQKSIVTEFVTQDNRAMVQILSFLHSHGWEEQYREWIDDVRLSDFVESHYKKGTTYVFPFQHTFVSVRKV